MSATGGVDRVVGRIELDRSDPLEGVRVLAVAEDVDLLDAVAPAGAPPGPELRAIGHVLERSAHHVADPGSPEIGKTTTRRTRDRPDGKGAVQRVREAEQVDEGLLGDGVPAGHLPGQPLEQPGSAGPASIDERVPNVPAPTRRVARVQQPGPQQLADVGHRPVVRLLDAAVGHDAVDAAPLDRRLPGKEFDESS